MSMLSKRCVPCEGGVSILTDEKVQKMLSEIADWAVDNDGISKISRTFYFDNYYENIAFINAVAWISHQENHHPYLEIEFNRCTVKYWTHAIDGLSENDFICANKINSLYRNKS